MKRLKKEVEERPVVFCRDCAHARVDEKFENLSLDGKPTLLICDIIKWPKRIITEKGCKDYQKRTI